ncbi:hypothetical protein B9G53_16295 [Pseudanabaena sp. SR411]|uniref:hypothetical protein n=1 Tax=Pseudanabaena sp. SR411 TaxID=1980935 RepID=UPI000B9848C6|nr:hypothetical protein [Pseudanabaena sp. SR411]OYQ63569.1 hypothetical protein B9G53_16295 [Pseudanabaena sp. SR411]
MKRTQVKVNLSLPFKALIEMISSLELREKIKLRELLDRDIAVTQQKTQNLTPQETSQELEPAIESFRRGWDDVMDGRTKPISELWEGIETD